MKWSKLKKRAESFLAISLQGRIRYHTTRYVMRQGYEGHGRGWITLDGQEIANFSEIEYEYAHGTIASELMQINNCADYTNPKEQEGYYLAQEQAHDLLDEQSLFSQNHFEGVLRNYPNLPIEAILQSDDPLIRALGMFDGRLGKRRLRTIDISIDARFSLAHDFYKIRCEAEGIKRH